MVDNISTHVTRCLDHFRSAVDAPEIAHTNPLESTFLQKARHEHTQFRLWSGNIGAHRTGMSSLDYRLRDSSHIRTQIIRLLQDLTGLLEDTIAIIAGEKLPWDQLSGGEDSGTDEEAELENISPDTELDQIAIDLADVVDCLLRLSVAIRNPAPHDRFVASNYTETSYYEPFDIQHVYSKFNSINPALAERLGKAISRRRQYFKYRKAHHMKLSHGLDQHHLADADAPQTIASSIPEHLKEKLGSGRTAVLQEDGSDTGLSQTSYATSAADSEQRRVPSLPKEAYDGPFECPFCYMIIVVTTRVAWKKHVHGDLRPYICLVGDCITPEREFSQRHRWMDHVKQNHWNVYKCPSACDLTFQSISECKEHVIQSHPSAGALSKMDALIKLSAQPLDIREGLPCPLCGETVTSVRQYQRHVGRHQEQLALFALPSLESNEESGPDEDESIGADSVDSRLDMDDAGNIHDGLGTQAKLDVGESDSASVVNEHERIVNVQSDDDDQQEDENHIELMGTASDRENEERNFVEEQEEEAELQRAKQELNDIKECEARNAEKARLEQALERQRLREDKEAKDEAARRDREAKEAVERYKQAEKDRIAKQKLSGEGKEMEAEEAVEHYKQAETDRIAEEKQPKEDKEDGENESEETAERHKQAQEAIERYKQAEWDRMLKEKHEKEVKDLEYKRRLEEDLRRSGLDDRDIEAIMKKEKVKKERESTPTAAGSPSQHRGDSEVVSDPTVIRYLVRKLDSSVETSILPDFDAPPHTELPTLLPEGKRSADLEETQPQSESSKGRGLEAWRKYWSNPSPLRSTEYPGGKEIAALEEDSEKIRLETEIKAAKNQQEKADAYERQKHLEALIRKDAEEAVHQRMEALRIAQEETKKEIEKVKIEAENAARERIEAERKAEEERVQLHAEAMRKAEMDARLKFEAELKAAEEARRREVEALTKPGAEAKANYETKAETAEEIRQGEGEEAGNRETKARAEAERHAKSKFEAEVKASEVSKRGEVEREAQMRLEAELKVKAERRKKEVEEEIMAEMARIKFETAIRAEAKAKAAAAKKVQEEAERLFRAKQAAAAMKATEEAERLKET